MIAPRNRGRCIVSHHGSIRTGSGSTRDKCPLQISGETVTMIGLVEQTGKASPTAIEVAATATTTIAIVGHGDGKDSDH